jgi:phosphatidate cytidylyltransferase
MMSRNLVLRLASAVLLIPVVFGVLIAGGWVFGVFVSLAFGLAVGEWFTMSQRPVRNLLLFLIGLVYLAVSFALFAQLRIDGVNGLFLTLLLLLVVWASDTGAYIFGRLIGGPKMAPSISPNKTWSGMAGSQIGAAAVFTGVLLSAPALVEIVPNEISVPRNQWPWLVFCGAFMGFIGQVGDLIESKMKRRADMKDSGNLIPGHGGMLDRIDALLLVIPVFYLVIEFGLK